MWWARLAIIAGLAAAIIIVTILNFMLGLFITAALAAIALLGRRVEDDGLEVEVVENGDEVVLVARARYGLGLDVHTTDYGFLIRNARGASRKIRLGFPPVIVRKGYRNGVMILVCRKHTS